MTIILHKRGNGIPAVEDFASVGEILIDTTTGTAYTLTDTDGVVALGGEQHWRRTGPDSIEALPRDVHSERTTANRTQNLIQYTYGKIQIGQLDDWIPDAELESHANAIEVSNREEGTTVQISKNGKVRATCLYADDNVEVRYARTEYELNFRDRYPVITVGGEWADWDTNRVGPPEENNRTIIAEPKSLIYDYNDNSIEGVWKFHGPIQADEYFDSDGWRISARYLDKQDTEEQRLKGNLVTSATIQATDFLDDYGYSINYWHYEPLTDKIERIGDVKIIGDVVGKTFQANDFLDADGNSIIVGGGGAWDEVGNSIVWNQTDGSGTFIMDTRPSSMWNRAQMYLYEQANNCGGWIAAGRDAMQFGWAREIDPATPDSGTRTTDMTLHDNGQVSINQWQKPPSDEKFYVNGTAKVTETIQAADFLDAEGNSIIGAGGDPEWSLVGDVEEDPIGFSNYSQSAYLGYTDKSNPLYAEQAVGIGFNATAGYGGVGIGHDASGATFGTSVGRSAKSTDNATAIGNEAKALYALSIALGNGAEATKPYEFAISSNIQEVNFSGATVQAIDFLDADGNSIIGGGGGESLWQIESGPDASSGGTKHTATIADNPRFNINWVTDWAGAEFFTSIKCDGLDTQYLSVSEDFDSRQANIESTLNVPIATSVESIVLGGIVIPAADAEAPFSDDQKTNAKSIQNALVVEHETLGRTVEIDKEGIIRANAFTDMGGNPIGGGGGITAELDSDFVFEDPWTGEQLPSSPTWVVAEGLSAGHLHTADWISSKTAEFRTVKAVNIDTHAPLYGSVSSAACFFTEANVFGGINITALDQERPEELPFDLSDEQAESFKSKTRSIQYALTVTHETLGRTVEIDKEGIIRANAFTDMEGNPYTPTSINTGSAGVAIGSAYGFGGNTYYLYPTTSTGTYDSKGCLGDSGARWSVVHSETYYKGGSPLIAAEDLIEAFTTLQSAIADEDDPASMKKALTDSLGGLIQKYQSMERADP